MKSLVGVTVVFARALTLGLAASDVASERSETSHASGGGAPRAGEDERAPDDYVGSATCARCHQPEHAQWKESLHVQMTKPVAEARVAGDFRPGTALEENGRSYKMSRRDGRYLISVAHKSRDAVASERSETSHARGAARGWGPARGNESSPRAREEEFRVDYTLGAFRYQGYLSTLSDGRIYVLPVFWHLETGRWVDYKEITPLPDGDHDYRQIWNVNCFNCHATNLVQNFDVPSKTYKTTWTEMGIGCEACHGPGRAHIALMDEWEARPASKPAYDRRATNRDLSRVLKIFSPRSAEPRQVFDACGYCHGNKTNGFVGFRPGDRYEDYALPFLISTPTPPEDPQGDYWPDGRPNRFNRPQALTLSDCFMKGKAVCTDCHSAHGSRNAHSLKVPIEKSDSLCLQCHQSYAVNVTAHTRHPAASAGSRCIECHMSDVNWRLMTRRRDHTMEPPVPELTARYGTPNGCTTCHDDRTPEWAAAAMDRWYGDSDRRRGAVRVADAMYRAGSGDVAAIPQLVPIAVDRSRGLLLRASAADFIGRLAASSPEAAGALPVGPVAGPTTGSGATPHWLRTLIGAANDPEPIVRVTAVQSLGRVADKRALPAIVARLVDRLRMVRAAAVAALLATELPALEGPAAVAFARALDDYEVSLRTFPDSAGSHVGLARVAILRGRLKEAEDELDIAASLDPADQRPAALRKVINEAKRRLPPPPN